MLFLLSLDVSLRQSQMCLPFNVYVTYQLVLMTPIYFVIFINDQLVHRNMERFGEIPRLNLAQRTARHRPGVE